jgi:hypothetical protein
MPFKPGQSGSPERRFKPGQSGNPGGRPKETLSAAYRELMKQKFPGDPEGRTWAQMIALSTAQQATGKKAKYQAAAEIADRTEGRPAQSVKLSGDAGAPIVVLSKVPRPERAS